MVEDKLTKREFMDEYKRRLTKRKFIRELDRTLREEGPTGDKSLENVSYVQAIGELFYGTLYSEIPIGRFMG